VSHTRFAKASVHLKQAKFGTIMRIPTATYRIQFHSGFKFSAVKAIADYLAELGISDLYASPIFKARAGSTHGYDVVDPVHLNPELGTSEEFDLLIQDFQRRDIGWLQDIVPNHMAYDSQNLFLMDVLENGSDSEYFDYFDINWNHQYEDIRGRVLAPLLGNFYGECLENGEIQLQYNQTGLSVNYFGLQLPVRIESYSRFITQNLGHLGRSLGRRHPDFVKLLGILYLMKNVTGETKGKERYDQIAFVKGLLWELYEQNSEVKEFIDKNIEFFNGEKGNSESFNLLDSLLQEQFYRLSFWKVGAEEINYRRFFTVNELISVKVEELKVFNKTHALIIQLVEEGKFTGLRIDHIDGLYDPAQYLERLQERVGDTYITVEKILELEEQLPNSWKIQGTSGYEFLNYVNGVFCCNANEQKLEEVYSRFAKLTAPYEKLVAEKKQLIIEKNLAGDIENLAQRLKRIAGQSRQGSDFTQYGLKRALTEVLTLFPIYRTYISEQGATEIDRQYIQQTIEKAKLQVPLLLRELNYIETLLLGDDQESLTVEQKAERLEFIMRMQQITGPLMAKGVEDTLLYVYNRLLSLNEVGGNPGHFGITVDAFHAFNQQKSDRWTHSMNATATHDTKRGEDVRARLNILSEIPEEWEAQVKIWREINHPRKIRNQGTIIPDDNDEYFFYQTLVGSFPFTTDPFTTEEYSEFVQRIKDYVVKAVREAKVHTAWLRPDNNYEDGYISFAEAVLAEPEINEFLQKFIPFQKRIAEYGILNSLSQTLLKNICPGVPDLYQGAELWDLSLVDPDNRRPVDYSKRVALLQEIKAQPDALKLLDQLFSSKEDGKIKLFLTYKLLQVRKENLALFQQGIYQPLKVSGKFENHVVAFARTYRGEKAIAIAPRFFTDLIDPGKLPLGEQIWADTAIELPPDMPFTWRNAVTTQILQSESKLLVAEALKHFPVALLLSRSSS
jgi:(1->4)-alpha-D-glucan 1-alpha-D-glucosylmutase